MNEQSLMAYALLSHLKETHSKANSSIVEIFFPIVKKAIVEYADEKGQRQVMGKNITEIRNKVTSYFGLEIPISVLDFILKQIAQEVDNEKIFSYNNDKSFVINSFVFQDIDEKIKTEKENIELLKKDFLKYCELLEEQGSYDELIDFITSNNIGKLDDINGKLNINYIVPKYVKYKLDNEDDITHVINDVYLGSLLSNYLAYDIKKPVAKTELLIDTNFFISLIDLNTEEATETCKQLLKLGQKLGYRFTILFSTIDQIKSLLSNKIKFFHQKDIGISSDADIFGACVRRDLSKTDLERIKDHISDNISSFGVVIVHENQIKPIVKKAGRSEQYKEFLKLRNNQHESALNDAIAYHYVNSRRGNHINEFSDVKCWFLNNSYNKDYYIDRGYKLRDRYKIGANELLALLWLSNPAQQEVNTSSLAKGGLSNYIAKYRNYNTPSEKVIRDINQRAASASKNGEIEPSDIYSICIRMAEGHISDSRGNEILKMDDNDFIDYVKEQSEKDKKVSKKLHEQNIKLENQEKLLNNQSKKIDELIESNRLLQDDLKTSMYEKEKQNKVEELYQKKATQLIRTAFGYLFFLMLIVAAAIFNSIPEKEIVEPFWGFIAILILSLAPFIASFFNLDIISQALTFTLRLKRRKVIKNEIIEKLNKEYDKNNSRPKSD